MAETQPGAPYTPYFIVLDANGSPYTSGVSGTMTLYGPASATALGSGAIAHLGDGRWGYTFAGSLLTTPGTYRFAVASLVTPGGTLVNQTGAFTVGQPGAWTLRELVVSIRHALRDGWEGTATGSGSTTTLVDSKYARGSNADWLGSELLILEPGATTDPNPLTVSGFTASTGTFAWPASQAVTATTTGQDFILGNLGGRGWSHRAILAAIAYACRRLGGAETATDETSLTFDTSTAEYLVPSTFGRVTGVAYRPAGGTTGAWLPIAGPRYWEWQPERQRLVFTRFASGYAGGGNGSGYGRGFAIPHGAALRLTGTTVPYLPGALGETVEASGARVRDLALIELQTWSPAPEHRQAALMRAARGGARVGRLP